MTKTSSIDGPSPVAVAFESTCCCWCCLVRLFTIDRRKTGMLIDERPGRALPGQEQESEPMEMGQWTSTTLGVVCSPARTPRQFTGLIMVCLEAPRLAGASKVSVRSQGKEHGHGHGPGARSAKERAMGPAVHRRWGRGRRGWRTDAGMHVLGCQRRGSFLSHPRPTLIGWLKPHRVIQWGAAGQWGGGWHLSSFYSSHRRWSPLCAVTPPFDLHLRQRGRVHASVRCAGGEEE